MAEKAASRTRAKPFLRWAGGKTWLTKHLPSLLPEFEFKSYHEPFLGGASIFLAINPPGRVFLSDLNAELVATYRCLRDQPDAVIDAMAEHANTKEHYYAVRSQDPSDEVERAARFIYLNQTSFNGIYRVNLEGRYNVPYGNRSKDFLDAENLRLVAGRLAGATIECADFYQVGKRVKAGDLVFLDPPYTVSHNGNGFIKYNQKLFSIEDQARLSKLIDRIKKKGAYYLLTNAAHATIAELFEKGDRRLELARTSRVGGKQAVRGRTTEYVFTNVGDNG